MRYTLILVLLCCETVVAGETILYASIRGQPDIEITDELRNRCVTTWSTTPHRREELVIDCTSVGGGPLGGARFFLDRRATRRNQYNSVFECVKGCGPTKARRLLYGAVESGC